MTALGATRIRVSRQRLAISTAAECCGWCLALGWVAFRGGIDTACCATVRFSYLLQVTYLQSLRCDGGKGASRIVAAERLLAGKGAVVVGVYGPAC